LIPGAWKGKRHRLARIYGALSMLPADGELYNRPSLLVAVDQHTEFDVLRVRLSATELSLVFRSWNGKKKPSAPRSVHHVYESQDMAVSVQQVR